MVSTVCDLRNFSTIVCSCRSVFCRPRRTCPTLESRRLRRRHRRCHARSPRKLVRPRSLDPAEDARVDRDGHAVDDVPTRWHDRP